MNVYIIARLGGVGWDENAAVVVVHRSEREARDFVYRNLSAGDEWRETWLDPSLSECRRIGIATDPTPGILLVDFCAG